MTFGNRPSEIERVLDEALEEYGCPGILCAVHYRGHVSTYSAGAIGSVDHDRPFPIYSITKSFTAVVIMSLCERRGSFLDEAVVSLLPGLPIPPDVTVRQLLNHTGGLSDYFASKDYREAVRNHPENPWPFDKLLQVGLERTPLFAPGAGWAYSNPGYMILNLLIERLAGEDFYECVARMILRPLGLQNTRPYLDPDRDGLFLEAEEPTISGDFRRRYSPGWIGPGCLISTVSEVVRFFDGLFSGKLIREESLRQMTETVPVPVPSRGPIEAAMGLGLMHGRNDPLGAGYGHGGGGPGYTTYAVCYPGPGGNLSVSLVMNRSLPATPFEVAERVVSAVRRFPQ